MLLQNVTFKDVNKDVYSVVISFNQVKGESGREAVIGVVRVFTSWVSVALTDLQFLFFLSREEWGDQKESRNRCAQVLVTCQEADDVLCRYPHKHSR